MAESAATEALMDALTHRVRFLSLPQIARTFWPQRTQEATRKHLARLAERGWIESVSVVTHPELPLARPVFSWKPDDEPPDCAGLAYQCQRRWKEPLTSLTVWRATERMRWLRGGQIIPLRRAQATHDLHVGALYCNLFLESPQDAADWQGEDNLLPLPEERLPDALITDTDGTMRRVIEFGGTCKAKRVAKLHAFGVRYEVPYELW